MGKEKLVVDKTTSFTTAKLVVFLNKVNGKNRNGKPFTTNDVQQYVRRKKLPMHAGGHPIEVVRDEDTGLRLLKVDFNSVAKRKLRTKKEK